MAHAARLGGIDTKYIRILQDIILDATGWTAEEYRAAQRQQHLKEINSPKLTTKDTTP
ncbi:hypothetical protein [Variovorax sp. LG9.2]|uniref:hypothetical protein n=1 Tax=Variovorax sp. LG9.2 TaxID=3048626 RepID=UPI002B2340E9|nr:hypothetical protein [Variovorax sp. LG9.2]MEB0057293.1 hypothetical protein [Variovorax sp. LG9.2]